MEIVLLIVVGLLLWGILRALKTKNQIEVRKTIVQVEERTKASLYGNWDASFARAKQDGRVLEWAADLIESIAKTENRDYLDVQLELQRSGLDPSRPEWTRAIKEESGRRGLPCKYFVDEDLWNRAWNEAPEYPHAELEDYSYSVCGCPRTDTYNTLKLADCYEGLQLWTLMLAPYKTCPFCGKECETWRNNEPLNNAELRATQAAEDAEAVARWKAFAERHPEQAQRIQSAEKLKFLDERRQMAYGLNEKLKLYRVDPEASNARVIEAQRIEREKWEAQKPNKT